MNVQQKGLITLIKSALSGSCLELPEGFSLDSVIDVANEHQLCPLIYYGAVNCGYDKNSDEIKTLFSKALPLVFLDEEQRKALGELYSLFENNGIDYVPLKGSGLKSLYPKPEMRTMGDADILIRVEQYDAICEVMTALGYTEKIESDHEIVWTKGSVCIELHKRLIPSYNEDFYSYFGDGWGLAGKICNTRYAMSDEMHFVYLFAHFAKHYRDGGIGIKHLTDLWVYRNVKPELDWKHIKTELGKLRLHKFFENVEKTLEVWFSGEVETSATSIISDTVFKSGPYGTAEAMATSTIIRETQGKSSFASVKLANRIRTVFLPYRQMCEKYGILKKASFLLPVMWIVRMFHIIIFKKKRVLDYIEKEKRLTDSAIWQRKESLNAVGLDFYFGVDGK